jgi:hypothetical protein
MSVVKFDSLFIFSNWQMSHHVSILNINNHHLTEIVRTGDGPDEAVSYIPVTNNRKKIFMYADRIRKAVFSLNYANDECAVTKEFRMESSIQNLFCLAELNSETFIATGLFSEGRMLVYNKETQDYFYAETYPENEAIKNISPRHKAALYNNSRIGIHPDGKKFAIIYNGLLDIYEQRSVAEIRHVKANHYYFPEFTANEVGPAIVYGEKNKRGFIDIACDEQYLYLLYTDCTYEEMFKTYSIPWGNTITVFDWTGTPKLKYVLDKPVQSFFMDNDTLWAINPDFTSLYKILLVHQAM